MLGVSLSDLLGLDDLGGLDVEGLLSRVVGGVFIEGALTQLPLVVLLPTLLPAYTLLSFLILTDCAVILRVRIGDDQIILWLVTLDAWVHRFFFKEVADLLVELLAEDALEELLEVVLAHDRLGQLH